MPYSPLAAGHLTRPTWHTDTHRSKTDRVAALAKQYGVNMQQIALAWHWAKGVASPIVGATKSYYLDDTVNALSIKLTDAGLAYLEELYVPHRIIGAIDHNPADGVMLLDEKK